MDESERRARARSEATEWWLSIEPGSVPQAQREHFVRWLRESPIHVEEMLRVAQVHKELSRFDAWQDISTEGAREDTSEETIVEFPNFPTYPSLNASPGQRERATATEGSEGTNRWQERRGLGAWAASLLVVAGGAAWVAPKLLGQTIATERGERRELALSDGSVLQVDPQSRLRVRFDEHSRRIELKQGRALFRVAKDSYRPFTVEAHETVIRALGTAFAVERKAHDVTVTVAEGKVSISAATPSPRASQSTQKTAPVSVLTANQQLTVQRSGAAERVREVDSSRELAWTEGRLVFDNQTIAAAVEQFNRYNNLRLRIADPALASLTVNGVFNASEPESFVQFLQTANKLTVDRSHAQEITLALRE